MDTRRYDGLIIGKGEINDPQRLELHTKRRFSIPNARPRLPRPPEAMRDAFDRHKAAHPSLKMRNLDSTYNCVGLVFASRRTVIDIAFVRKILSDDDYKSIAVPNAQRGDLVVYEDQNGEPCHIGIIWALDPQFGTCTVLSQWGEDGEYFHLIDQVPTQFSRGRHTIWTERQI